MNEKEARDWLYNPKRRHDLRIQHNQSDLAIVYLEALEKANVLEEALIMALESLSRKFQPDDTGGKYWAKSVNENVVPAKNHIKLALAKWEKEK